MKPPSESHIVTAIIAAANAHPNVWLMRNRKGSRGHIAMGLIEPGSADIVGMVRYDDDRFHEGCIASFCALEVKLPRGPGVPPSKVEPTHEQLRFLERVRELGGVGAVVHSVDEALRALGLK
jgi:hypothetical protein